MHIKEICLEGFKSYAGRTVVSGFDPLFNAITGLNGSGKSNILDSICFVLGITDLRLVRAASLQELVYKQGQAGVTKATVSIVFDNSDRSRSPLGYEDSPEITVTRQVNIPSRCSRSLCCLLRISSVVVRVWAPWVDLGRNSMDSVRVWSSRVLQIDAVYRFICWS